MDVSTYPVVEDLAVLASPATRASLLLTSLLTLAAPTARAQAPAPAPAGCGGVVFTLDGSGCLCTIAPELRRALADCGCPLGVEDFAWSHGPGRVFADLHGRSRHAAKGDELAGAIQAYRQAHPGAKVYLVCHSSGAAVGLAAARCLPAGSVDRIVLLVPALSPRCDLRPVLCASREGVDVFYSRKDVISHALAVVGTADGRMQLSAGCTGFEPVGCDGPDAALYANLRQYAWDPDMRRAGHTGGHFGCVRASFFSTYLVPLLCGGVN